MSAVAELVPAGFDSAVPDRLGHGHTVGGRADPRRWFTGRVSGALCLACWLIRIWPLRRGAQGAQHSIGLVRTGEQIPCVWGMWTLGAVEVQDHERRVGRGLAPIER